MTAGAALLAAVAVLVGAFGENALGATKDPGRQFGKPKTGKGFISAEGNARKPRGLFLRVTSTPYLVVSVTTVVHCRREGKMVSKDGAFNAIGPFTRKIGQPIKRADSCFVSIVATYEQGSEDPIKAELFARHPKR
jgi:hypothetical protein